MHFFMSVTPDAELVVAPAGYSLYATIPAALAARTSSGEVESVRYRVISGSKTQSGGTAAKILALYSIACEAPRNRLQHYSRCYWQALA